MLLLVQDGRLALTDDVRKFLPEHGYGPTITIDHLLTHTSGIRDWVGRGQFMPARVTRPLHVPGTAPGTASPRIRTTRADLRTARQFPRRQNQALPDSTRYALRPSVE